MPWSDSEAGSRTVQDVQVKRVTPQGLVAIPRAWLGGKVLVVAATRWSVGERDGSLSVEWADGRIWEAVQKSERVRVGEHLGGSSVVVALLLPS